jgi:hypothetical protein
MYFQFVRMFSASLSSSEYIILRNSLIILARIVGHFPRDKRALEEIERNVVNLAKVTEREDMKLMALNYVSKLKKKKRQNPDIFGPPPKSKRDRLHPSMSTLHDRGNVNNDLSKSSSSSSSSGIRVSAQSADRGRGPFVHTSVNNASYGKIP